MTPPKLVLTKEPNIYTRENMDGSVTYWLQYKASAKRKRETFDTFEAAKIRKGQIVRDRSEGRQPIPRRVPFKDYALKCLSGYYGSRKSYPWAKIVIEAHLIPFFGGRYLASIQPSVVREYRQSRFENPKKPVSNATVNREVSVLSKIMSLAVEDDLLQENRVRRVDKLPEPEGRTLYITPEQERKLLKACTGRRAHLRPIVAVILDTASRLGETMALEWPNVDLTGRTVYFVGDTTKDGDTRSAPISVETAALLRRLKSKSERLTSETARRYVFTLRGRRLLEPYMALHTAMEKAGIPRPKGTGFHLLRHTAATRYRSKGLSRADLRELMGHSSEKMTQRYDHSGALYANAARDILDRGVHMGVHMDAGQK